MHLVVWVTLAQGETKIGRSKDRSKGKGKSKATQGQYVRVSEPWRHVEPGSWRDIHYGGIHIKEKPGSDVGQPEIGAGDTRVSQTSPFLLLYAENYAK